MGFTGVNNIFLISAQNIDCGYSLEPPRRYHVIEYEYEYDDDDDDDDDDELRFNDVQCMRGIYVKMV